MTELLIQRKAKISEIKVLNILEEIKKAVQMSITNQTLNDEFVYAVKIDGETYILHIEKYVPENQLIEKYNSLLTNM